METLTWTAISSRPFPHQQYLLKLSCQRSGSCQKQHPQPPEAWKGFEYSVFGELLVGRFCGGSVQHSCPAGPSFYVVCQILPNSYCCCSPKGQQRWLPHGCLAVHACEACFGKSPSVISHVLKLFCVLTAIKLVELSSILHEITSLKWSVMV